MNRKPLRRLATPLAAFAIAASTALAQTAPAPPAPAPAAPQGAPVERRPPYGQGGPVMQGPPQGRASYQRYRGSYGGASGYHGGPHGFGGDQGGMGAVFHIAPAGMWWKNPGIVQRLTLTPEQTKKMDDIFQQSRIQLIDLRANIEKQNAILEPMLSANPPDTGRTLAQIDRVAQARADLEKADARMLLGIRGVLTPEQWTKLQTHDRPGGGGSAPAGGAGQPGRGGRGPGSPGGQNFAAPNQP